MERARLEGGGAGTALFAAIALASVACARPSPSSSSSTSPSSSTPAPSAFSPTADPPPLTTATIELDLDTLLRDSFDPRSDAGRAIVDRMRGAPERYEQRFDSLYVRYDREPKHLELPLVSFFLYLDAPALEPQIAATRSALVMRYDDALSGRPDLPVLDEATRARLEGRLAALEALPLSWRAPSPAWKERSSTSVCVVHTRRPTKMLRVTYDCLCGQPLACAVRDGRLETRYDQNAPANCSDCYPSEAICALPDAIASDGGAGRVSLAPGGDAGSFVLSTAQRCHPKR